MNTDTSEQRTAEEDTGDSDGVDGQLLHICVSGDGYMWKSHQPTWTTRVACLYYTERVFSKFNVFLQIILIYANLFSHANGLCVYYGYMVIPFS